MPNIPLVDKPEITSAVFLGDSLSDEGVKYNQDICGCVPFKWFLYHSDYNNFTNGHTWAYIFGNIFNTILKEKATWSAQEKSTYFKNVAEGGATTFDYRNIKSFFKYFKGFILSFFLGNIQNQAKKVKKILNPKTLGIIFAGANDLVTLGYDDAEGVERTILGIIKTIETLTDSNEGSNFLKYLLLVGLPDISETPRFKDKSPAEKLKMKLACQQYNQKLQELANEYQYVNFDCCTIYHYKNINHLDLEAIKKIEKAIVIIGEGEARTVIFINNREFINNKPQELKKVSIKLTKDQQAIFSKDGEIFRDGVNGNKLDTIVNKVTKQAKLNIDLKMLDINSIWDKILRDPADYGFTEGCAIYYLTEKNKDRETDESLISTNIIGNAVIIKETDGFFSYLIVKDGALIKDQEQIVELKFELSTNNQSALREKIKQHSAEDKIIRLVSAEDKHDSCNIDIIRSVVKCYEEKFKKELMLTDINNTVLNDDKRNHPSESAISWDGLHPSGETHDILASYITENIKANYLIKNHSQFEDDSAIGIESKLDSDYSEESPGSLSSGPSLLEPNIK